jgi:hypothetical protein
MILFVEQLKALKTTMSSVAPEHFDMENWVCGTVACVCGHQAMSGDLTHFTRAEEHYKDGHDATDTADSLSSDLDESCIDIFGTTNLSESIWQIIPKFRKAEAKSSKMLTEEQLKHPHLTTDSSPEIAVSYIDMVLGVLDEKR